MSLVSYWDSEKVGTERYNEEEMLQNLIGKTQKLPISLSMDQILEPPSLDVPPPEFSTDRNEGGDLLDLDTDEQQRLIQSLRSRYTEDQIIELLKKFENEQFFSNFDGFEDFDEDNFHDTGYAPDIIDSMKPAYYFNAMNRTAYGGES